MKLPEYVSLHAIIHVMFIMLKRLTKQCVTSCRNHSGRAISSQLRISLHQCIIKDGVGSRVVLKRYRGI